MLSCTVPLDKDDLEERPTMYKLVACWTAPKPGDVEAFERHYLGVHGPLAARVPHLRRLVLTRTDAGLEGAAPAFHRVAEMVFDSPEDLERSARSEDWKRLRVDAGEMVSRFGVELQVAMGWEQDATPGAPGGGVSAPRS